MRLGLAAVCTAMMIVFCTVVSAQNGPVAAPTTKVTIQSLPDVPSPQAGFDAMKATDAYLAEVHGEARAKSDSYFEGGYVLILVDAIYAITVSAILLWLGISARIRDFAQAQTKSRFWQVPIYAIAYTILTVAMTFPLTVYESFIREHAYGLSNQNFAQWFGDFGTGFAVNLVITTILITIIYAVIRRAPRTWWIWGTLVTVVFLAIGAAIAPVFIAPLFNHYEPLPEGKLKSEILSIARSEGIPATNVYEFDASRQSKRVSANVSGMFGTTRISMNDNLLKRCTPREIIAVLGHEMGHYVLNHVAILITWMGLLIFVAFAFLNWGFKWLVKRFGAAWGVKGIDDPAGLPVFMALLSFFFFLATPVQNTITRTVEAQADIFGVNAVRQPDGFAKATLMLSEYRKLDPTPLEEFVFYDHPSGRSRIYMMMRWKAEHLNDWDIKNGPVSPQ
ncbi:MAG TPA: M48 family metallopeptidase [Rhizomicrobium sp.]|nr:M48 family metallopeptidase [Rhizomicrobium sp.]